jgi:hypothetical protein
LVLDVDREIGVDVSSGRGGFVAAWLAAPAAVPTIAAVSTVATC